MTNILDPTLTTTTPGLIMIITLDLGAGATGVGPRVVGVLLTGAGVVGVGVGLTGVGQEVATGEEEVTVAGEAMLLQAGAQPLPLRAKISNPARIVSSFLLVLSMLLGLEFFSPLWQ